jgi:hypothetical protein
LQISCIKVVVFRSYDLSKLFKLLTRVNLKIKQ